MNLTTANQLTILRMLLIPAFVILLLYGHQGWALITFMIAGLTDLLDGLMARLAGEKTTLGAWLDPMADKLLLVTMFVVLTLPGIGSANQLPVWFTILFGKIATATYILTGVVTLYYNYLGQKTPIVGFFVYASLVITLVSAFHYLIQVLRIGRAGDEAKLPSP